MRPAPIKKKETTMKCFTLYPGGIEKGILLRDGRISIGEPGRGRTLVTVPVPQGAEVVDIQGEPPTITGRLMSIPAKNSPAGAVLVVIRDHSGFRGSWSLGDQQGVTILAEGYCAQGAAGRMGGGPEYLAVLSDGGSATITRSGRLYGKPSILRVQNTGGVITVTDVIAAESTARAAAALEAL
jgi:hypothetical protein